MPIAQIESLDREGRGVARAGGKTVFVEGAIPGETVEFAPRRCKPTWEIAELVRVVGAPGGGRVVPRCRYFGTCGGCSMQHVDDATEIAAKQRVLEDALWHIAHVRPEMLLRPVHGIAWGYRHRARMSVRSVAKKGGALVGFRERKSTYVTDMRSCEVLPGEISALIPELRALINSLSIAERIPQIEVAVGEGQAALVFRVLAAPASADEAALIAFSERHRVQVWLQPAGPDSAWPLHPASPAPLYYTLPDFDLRIEFGPTDFTQVNPAVNRMLVRQAIALLDPQPGERIADFFSGLGNFALPAARRGAAVTGFEASGALAARARANAQRNGLEALCRFEVADLFDPAACTRLESFQKALVDPPREGAIELVKSFANRRPGRIVYVSCDPATLARDAAVLVHVHGLRLAAAGVLNMFPHTSHVESLALFLSD